MIIGVGIDLIEINRITTLLERQGETFIKRILTDKELPLLENKKARLPEFIAGRFAAKEAIAKALGCGIGNTVGFHDIVIASDPLGRPTASLSAEAWSRIGLLNAHIHLSITHTDQTAGAYVIIES